LRDLNGTSSLTVKEYWFNVKTASTDRDQRSGNFSAMSTINMPLPHLHKLSHEEENAFARDERWLLAQRVVRSKGFQRAAQLRAILLYVSKFAILGTDEQLREDDIAREVLGR